MTEREIKLKLVENADAIAKQLSSGKDILITKSASGVVIKKMTVQKM